MTWGDAGVAVTALEPSASASLAFRMGGSLRVVVVVKATFTLVPDGPMRLVAAEPIVRADQLREPSPSSSLVSASDLVPLKPRADVFLIGHARAPNRQPTPAMAVRLLAARDAEVLIDKSLAVRGLVDPGAQTREPCPFISMRLAWELAAFSEDYPVGVTEAPDAWPRIVDPRRPGEPAGFGPVSPRWAARLRQAGFDASFSSAAIPDLPPEFPWSFFNAAPADQQAPYFRGDEWIGFEGMNAEHARVVSRLPGAVARAHVYGPQGPSLKGQPVALVADTVTLDADRLRCSVVWRGSFPLPHEKYLPVLHVVAGIATSDRPLALPESYERALALRDTVSPMRIPSSHSLSSVNAADASASGERPKEIAKVPVRLRDATIAVSADAMRQALPFAAGERPPVPAARLGSGSHPINATVTLSPSAPSASSGAALPFAAGSANGAAIDTDAAPAARRSRDLVPSGATVFLNQAPVGKPLPFGPTPPAVPPPPRPSLGGSTLTLSPHPLREALPFGKSGSPPSPLRAADRVVRPQSGATVELSGFTLEGPLPLAEPPPAPASPRTPLPVFVASPMPVDAPVASATAAESQPPQTLGAHFLAAMARARGRGAASLSPAMRR